MSAIIKYSKGEFMARISFITSVILLSGMLTGCLESGSGSVQYNPYKDRPTYQPPIQTPEYSNDAADNNAIITDMYSRNETQVKDWVGFKLKGFIPSGFEQIPFTSYMDVASLANEITTANATQIQSEYNSDKNMLWAAMAVLNRSLAAKCYNASDGAATAECIVNWRNDNTAIFDTSRTELIKNTTVLTVDNATLTATNGYKMKFKIDDTGEIIGMTLTRDSGNVDLAKLGDSSTFYGSDIENGRVLELDYVSDAKQMGLSYSDFGLINILSSMDGDQRVDAWLMPFAGGYDDKKIAVADIDSDMTFTGRATGRVAKGAHAVQLQQDTARPTKLTFDTQSQTSTLTANFNNWYDVVVDSTGAISFTDYKNNNNGVDMQLAATADDGVITKNGANMNVGYYGPSTTPTEVTGTVQFTETGVDNGIQMDISFGAVADKK